MIPILNNVSREEAERVRAFVVVANRQTDERKTQDGLFRSAILARVVLVFSDGTTKAFETPELIVVDYKRGDRDSAARWAILAELRKTFPASVVDGADAFGCLTLFVRDVDRRRYLRDF